MPPFSAHPKGELCAWFIKTTRGCPFCTGGTQHQKELMYALYVLILCSTLLQVFNEELWSWREQPFIFSGGYIFSYFLSLNFLEKKICWLGTDHLTWRGGGGGGYGFFVSFRIFFRTTQVLEYLMFLSR